MRSSLHISAFPERLKKRRIELNMTQQELAEKTQISLKTISTWEKALDSPGSGIKHGPKASHIIDLCKALNCDFEYLFGSEEHSEPTTTHALIKEKTGLSICAIDTLMYLADKLNSEIPAYKMHAHAMLDFYSTFITDVGKGGAVTYYLEKIDDTNRWGLNEAEEVAFNDASIAIEFYRYEITKAIQEFLSNYLSKHEPIVTERKPTAPFELYIPEKEWH